MIATTLQAALPAGRMLNAVSRHPFDSNPSN
jgi:hypothetical protein